MPTKTPEKETSTLTVYLDNGQKIILEYSYDSNEYDFVFDEIIECIENKKEFFCDQYGNVSITINGERLSSLFTDRIIGYKF